MGPLRQFLRLTKPWERVVAGVVLAVGGALLGIYIISAIGVVLVILVVAGWLRRRRGGDAPAGTGAVEPEAGATSDAPRDAGES
jgi:hypothetical protein